MFQRLRRDWKELRHAPPGQRFQQHYERTRHSADRRFWPRLFRMIVVIGCLLVGLALTVLPGPAILFFAIAAVLLAAEFEGMAKALDRAELWGRKIARRWRDKWRHRRARRHGKKAAARTGG